MLHKLVCRWSQGHVCEGWGWAGEDCRVTDRVRKRQEGAGEVEKWGWGREDREWETKDAGPPPQ